MRNLTTEARKSINSREVSEIFIALLEINHPSFTQPIRVARDYENVIHNGNTYIAYPFEADLPDDTDETIPSITLTIDNVDRSIALAIRKAVGMPTSKLFIVRRAAPNTIEVGPFNFTVRDAAYNSLTVTATLSFDDILGQALVKHTFSPSHFPGGFGG